MSMRLYGTQFAQMSQHSTGLSGEGWQGDGWGVAWRDAQWQVQHSIAPIWTECERLQQLPPTQHLMVHARSASFPQHKGVLAYSQPYVYGPYAFVFNGFLRGVRLPRRVSGVIGAEKIWFLLQEQLAQGVAPALALAAVYATLERHSRAIQACNMGLSDGDTYACYNGNPRGEGYYRLHSATQDMIAMVCSEPFGGWAWQPSVAPGLPSAPV